MKTKTFILIHVLSIIISFQGFAQNKIDSTEFYISATLNAVRTIALNAIEQNSVGSIQLTKEHPLVINLMKSDDEDASNIESYVELGSINHLKFKAYSNSSINVSNVQIVMENLPGSQDNVQWVTMSSIKGYINSGECELKGNFSVNGSPISFEETKIICEDNDSLSSGRINDGSICNYNDIRFQYKNGSWMDMFNNLYH